MTSYKVVVKTNGDLDWVSNSLRFATREEAQDYGNKLALRWLAIREWEVQEDADEPNSNA